ncbi:MAG: HAMP domain-containing sensor histidine kinase [Candidatus Zixiibacteriota bacterium]
MDTHFASAERSDNAELRQEIDIISNNAVIDGLMNIVSGLLAVLNEHRQILSVNQRYLDFFGIPDARSVFGLRPGESVNCIHANDEPGGCGTSKFCSSCGAAISIVSALGTNQPSERTCAVTAKRNGQNIDLFFKVRSHPVMIDGQRFILIFLLDITREQKWAAMERVFFHDINNLISALIGKTDLMLVEPENNLRQMAYDVNDLAGRLMKEIEVQKQLLHTGVFSYQPFIHQITARDIIKNLQCDMSEHPAAKGKHITYPSDVPNVVLESDMLLISRIMNNMLLNALEASGENDTIRVSARNENGCLTFSVWNRQVIPEIMRHRIFQRNYSTKDGTGRGLGLYSIKLFGEEVLGGKVGFNSSNGEGTEFYLELPVKK